MFWEQLCILWLSTFESTSFKLYPFEILVAGTIKRTERTNKTPLEGPERHHRKGRRENPWKDRVTLSGRWVHYWNGLWGTIERPRGATERAGGHGRKDAATWNDRKSAIGRTEESPLEEEEEAIRKAEKTSLEGLWGHTGETKRISIGGLKGHHRMGRGDATVRRGSVVRRPNAEVLPTSYCASRPSSGIKEIGS